MPPFIRDAAHPFYNIRLSWYIEEADDVLVRTGRLQVARLQVARIGVARVFNPCPGSTSA